MAEVKPHPAVSMEPLDEPPEVEPENTVHGNVLRGHDVNLDIAVAQRCRHLEPDEAGPEHNCRRRFLGGRDDRPAVGQGAQRVDMRAVAAVDGNPHRFRTRGQQQCPIRHLGAVVERDRLRFPIDRRDGGVEAQGDLVF